MAARKGGDPAAHPTFIEYTTFIANHPAYHDMPDALNEKGTVQWEAPSNRGGGKHKDTHHKRRDWWRVKAVDVGIDPTSDQWISRTAKLIHPTKEKPCKRCGLVMTIGYAYPNRNLIRRIAALDYVVDTDVPDQTEHILEVADRLSGSYGERFLRDAPALFKIGAIQPPRFADAEALALWLELEYIPRAPRLLSPGAMSNAPDRFDGFHSFNLCCRSKADSGRHAANLRTYVTDRRVFEYWVDGDWVAADRLMGLIRTQLACEPCANGHAGPCAADHIGPISLGFAHRPEFQLLCTQCNSAKNNRMTHRDVLKLRAVEDTGGQVISWHSRPTWERCRARVHDDETALRLSKLLRDNRHTLMGVLKAVYDAGHFAFLIDLLNLDYADFDVSFEGLRAEGGYTSVDSINHEPRTTLYAAEQKARRCRVAFETLSTYWEKTSRNAFVVSDAIVERHVNEALGTLSKNRSRAAAIDDMIRPGLAGEAVEGLDALFRRAVAALPDARPPRFVEAHDRLDAAMDRVGELLAHAWDDERYVRTPWTTD